MFTSAVRPHSSDKTHYRKATGDALVDCATTGPLSGGSTRAACVVRSVFARVFATSRFVIKNVVVCRPRSHIFFRTRRVRVGGTVGSRVPGVAVVFSRLIRLDPFA